MSAIPNELARERMLDSSQAAALCGFSIPHWRRLYRSGRVPKPTRIGERKLGWRAGQLIDYVAEMEASSGAKN